MLMMGQLQGFWSRPKTDIAYVSKSSKFSNGASVNSTTIDTPTSVSENNLLLAWILHEGDATTEVACSGWTLHSQYSYSALVGSLLYKWATSAEDSTYTFSHTDSSYGGMGGCITNYSGSINKGHSPIYRENERHLFSYGGSADFGWDTNTLDVDIPGAIVVVLGAGFRDPFGTQVIYMFAETPNGYTQLTDSTWIGGYSTTTGNCCGGCVAYQKFTTPATALDGGSGTETVGSGGIGGEFGAAGAWYHFSQLLMII